MIVLYIIFQGNTTYERILEFLRKTVYDITINLLEKVRKWVKIMEKEKLICNMLGSKFFLGYHQKQVTLKCHETSKVMQLFLMLLHAGETGIPKGKILQNLYEREDIQDSKNALRILIFRLKKLLQDTELPKWDYIRTEKGYCIFEGGGELEIQIDAKEFKKTAELAKAAAGEEEQITLLRQACEQYRGEFLAQLSTEEWVMLESLRYKELYVWCLETLCGLLKKHGEYEEMLSLYNRAIALYPFDEWQVAKIDCLIAMDRYKDALKAYEETTTLFFEELGLSPSEKMLTQFKTMSGRIQNAAANMPNIQERLREGIYRRGAYYCSYPSFVDSYRIIARVVERTGTSVFLMLCTLLNSRGEPLKEDQILTEEMENLGNAIERSLRRGDIYTRYSSNQYLVLLSGIAQENCSITYNRINMNYKKMFPGHRVELNYSISSIIDIQEKNLL